MTDTPPFRSPDEDVQSSGSHVEGKPNSICAGPRSINHFETPLPRQRVGNWASNVHQAMDKMSVDDPATTSAQTTFTNKAMISAFMAFAQSSHEIAQSVLMSMSSIAQGVNTISASIQTPGAFSLKSGSTPQETSAWAKSCRQLGTEALSKYETPVARRPPRTPQGGPIPDAIRTHVATLFGKCAQEGHFPPPASLDERRNWVLAVDLDEIDEPDDPNDHDDHDNVETDSDMDLEFDPSFPYPDGPGHPKASPEALRIIWRMMRRVGVRSFRPDLQEPISSVCNAFLWRLAVKTFMKLVDAGEYNGVTRESCNESLATQMMHNHVNNSIRREFRERNNMSEIERARRDKLRRRNGRRSTRISEVMMNPVLAPLMGIVQACTSDDETDEEADPPPSTNRRGARQAKPCVVLKTPWRHERVQTIMMQLDRLRARRIASSSTKSNAPPARVRRRSENAKESSLPHQKRPPLWGLRHGLAKNTPILRD
ncbi:hypothetical protein PtA15_11A330 [Puccinia triticina]|uniref:Uncharacterized protein n=1 Tax=Puccinia triticina TaxID=208348 RepID=A0ABY7CYD4_9BASI|nr:uncharacterized protein PtA15_11A330 [Puccinia triticina]WAQ89640.1 hypothetical protein PtA15_11A330 [Puccinia triticina]